MRSAGVLCTVFVVMAGVSDVHGAELFVDAFRYSDPAWETGIEVDLSGVPGVTGVKATSPGGTGVTLDPFGPSQFASQLGPFGSFSDFHTATVGNWQMVLEFGAGNDAVYHFVVNDYRNPFTDGSFPPAPTMVSPLDGVVGVDPTPTFQWNNGGAHTGPIESLFVSVWNEADPGIGEMDSSGGGGLNLSDTSWTPSVVLPGGPAWFLVQYETNENEDNNVGTPVFNRGTSTVADPSISWDWSGGDLFSKDLVQFTVVPEPSTLSLTLLGLPAAWRWRRRRRA
jgi:hypothetical protein